MNWLLRLVLFRLLGGRAVTILALLALIRALRGARAQDVDRGDPSSGWVRRRSSARTR